LIKNHTGPAELGRFQSKEHIMNAPQTYLRRKQYGDKSWKANSIEDFDLNGRLARLDVSTFKNDRGQLVTSASIGFVNGQVVTTAIFSDFYRTLEVSKVRCTEKAVSEQQARAVAQWDSLKSDVLAYYAAKQAA
jgi:hypothetical protein